MFDKLSHSKVTGVVLHVHRPSRSENNILTVYHLIFFVMLTFSLRYNIQITHFNIIQIYFSPAPLRASAGIFFIHGTWMVGKKFIQAVSQKT